jgi:hypothetical protein
MKLTKIKSGDRQLLVEPTSGRQGRYSGGRSTDHYSSVVQIFFSQLFRQFRMLNCNLPDGLENLPTLFQGWFEYFGQNGGWRGV